MNSIFLKICPPDQKGPVNQAKQHMEKTRVFYGKTSHRTANFLANLNLGGSPKWSRNQRSINNPKFSSLTLNSLQPCEHHPTEEIRMIVQVLTRHGGARRARHRIEESNMALLDLSTEQALERADTEQTGEALYDLGILFSTGQGVDMDYVEAHKWFNLAALRGVNEARDWRAEIAREMSMDEISEAQRQAREWLSQH